MKIVLDGLMRNKLICIHIQPRHFRLSCTLIIHLLFRAEAISNRETNFSGFLLSDTVHNNIIQTG